MKNYQLFPVLLALAGFSFLLSCGNDTNNSSEAPPAAEKSEQAQTPATAGGTMATDAVPTDVANPERAPRLPQIGNEMRIKAFTGLLQGKWINEGDPAQIMQFDGNKVRYVNNGKLVEETDFSIDYSCESSHCRVNGEKPVGWCLTETSASGEKCKVVMRIDQQYFIFEDMTTGGKVQYKKDAKPQ